MRKLTAAATATTPAHALLAAILLLGLALRAWGMLWSLPVSNSSSFHPDEIFQVLAAANIDWRSLQLNPHFYNYGPMYLYLVSIFTHLLSAVGLLDASNLCDRFVAARFVTVILGSLTPYFVYLAGRRIRDEKTGLIAAAIAAVVPI